MRPAARHSEQVREVVIVEAARSAVRKRNRTLSPTHPIDVLGPVQRQVLERADRELALITVCCGGGLGTGTLIQRL